ncbi:MAG TPA: alkaline phosphatase family protein [Candidatus Dormibacteraeota bacterium]|nr:alkaline phosphatase family protein [Candidatus Dormibacteraeota bacterium]
MARGAVFLLVAIVAACAQSAPSDVPKVHVFVIVMENHSSEQAMSGQFISSLASRHGVAENYHAIAHPSVPNYLALTSGSTWGVTDDSYHVLPRQDIGTEMTRVGVTWRAYMEGMTGAGCIDSPLPYDPGHNPFAFYGGACPPNVVPLTSLASDLAGDTPRFVWITPDRCHDTHDCDVAVGDAWLEKEVGEITASRAWKSRGVLFITYDEDDSAGADNQVLTLVVAPDLGHKTSSRRYTHYSLLATIEDLLGLKRLGRSAAASTMSDLLPSTLSV